MKYLFLNEVISEKITGDWGNEGDKVNVLRTINFTNDGAIDYSNVVTRDIPEKVIERKKLVQGDVIIEKSGGSPSQPVGRVVYFERKDEVFLCNNFTAILRSNDLVFPKYFFYFLFSLHKLGITLKFQNKTTGIINLQLDKYLDRIQIPLPPLPEQKRIAEILDKADALRQKNKQLLATYDELLQATFLDMFDEAVTNRRNWEKERLDRIAKLERGRFSPRPRNDPSYFNGLYPFIQTGDISKSGNRLDSYIQTLNEKGIKVSKLFKKGTIVIAIVGATIGATAILEIDVYATDSIIGISVNQELANNVFLEFVMQFWKPILLKNAPEAARANINLEILRKLDILTPPITLQNQFAQIVENIEAQKALAKQSLWESEDLFNGLIQKSF